MLCLHLKAGDPVRVLYGAQAGKRGTVVRIDGRHVVVQLAGGSVLVPAAHVEVV